jgi:methyl-accepting chemotaxis protein
VVSGEVKITAENLSAAAEELSGKTSLFSDGAQSQASSTEEVNATLEELSAGMENISNSAAAQFDAITGLALEMKKLDTLIHSMEASIAESTELAEKKSENAVSEAAPWSS